MPEYSTSQQERGNRMFEAMERLDLEKIDLDLRVRFQSIQMIGQLEMTEKDYLQLAMEVRSVLRGNPANLDKIPRHVLSTLLVFCARYEETRESFWNSFLSLVGLGSGQSVQNRCRMLMDESWKNWPSHFYIPTVGYKYVTPILYHSILPQSCIEEMAMLIHSLGAQTGWDVVANLETTKLEKMLINVESRFHTSRPLARFVTDLHSRQLACELIQDLCEAAYDYLENNGDQTELIKQLEKHPVQLEVWNRLSSLTSQGIKKNQSNRVSNETASLQWDRKAHQLRIYIRKNRVYNSSRPGYYRIGTKRYPVKSTKTNQHWQIEPVALYDPPIGSNYNETIHCDLFSEDDKQLSRSTIKFTRKDILFFNPTGGEIGTLVNHDNGIGAGFWYVLLNVSYRLFGNNDKEITLIEKHPTPRSLENYGGFLIELKAGTKLRLLYASTEWLEESIDVKESSQRSLVLNGTKLPEAVEPDGTETFTGAALQVQIRASSWNELQGLSLQVRETVGSMRFQSHLLPELLGTGQASWSDERKCLDIKLEGILNPNIACRYRLKLLNGLLRAQYPAVEFNLVPEIKFIPDQKERRRTLFSEICPPKVTIDSAVEFEAESLHGTISSARERMKEVVWKVVDPNFEVELKWGNLTIQTLLYPAVLRCAIQHSECPLVWNHGVQVWHSEMMLHNPLLVIESHPDSTYRLVIGKIARSWKPFCENGRLVTSLSELKDNVKESGGRYVPISVEVRYRKNLYRLLIAIVDTNSDAIYEEGERISALRKGQVIHHPIFGRGTLSDFTDTMAIGQSVHAAKFSFDDFAGVTFFIPTTKRLRIYGDSMGAIPRVNSRPSHLDELLSRPRLTCTEEGYE